MAATRDYIVRMPRDVTVRSACEDVECDGWRDGWESHIDEATPLGRHQAAYIRQQSGRTFTERRTASGITVFRFERGQRCFAEHRTRPARLLVAQGGMVREHATFDDIAEDYTEHAGRLAEQMRRG